MKFKHRINASLLLVALCATTQLWAQNASIPALSEEPGLSKFRHPDGSYGVETIDPFTGALKIVATDLVVPSNGGLDLAVVRNYVSMQRTGTYLPSYLPGRTATGIGWDIHFGRVWRSNPGFLLPSGTSCGAINGGSLADSRYNPVLELPDGSRQVLVSANASDPYKFITASRWIGRCLPAGSGDGGLEITSPEGIVYVFNKLGRVADASSVNAFAFHPTSITHPNGTSITFTYATISNPSVELLRLNTVSHSEGHSLTFTYDDPTTRNARLRRIRLTGWASTEWIYNYDSTYLPAGTSGPTYHYLTSVTRPDNTTFAYQYNPAGATAGAFSLRKITTPMNGVVDYTYISQPFPRHTEGSIPRAVLRTKAISGVDTPATWTYTYIPADTAGETTDSTQVSGPSNCVEYTHQSATTSNGQLWTIGLLLDKKVRAAGSACSGTIARQEVYAWSPQTLADQAYWRAPNVIDVDTFVPKLDSLTITQDSTTYTTAYSNYDAYGNAEQVAETGQASRTTTRTFHIDTSLWIVKRLKNETIASAGTPGNYAVVRNFYANGDLQNESRAGVVTSYLWHTSGVSRGEIHQVTDANSKVTTYTNYKRGTPQNVSYAQAGVAMSRTVNDTGTVADETSPRAKTTGFAYDNVYELIGITTPKTTDSNFSVTRPAAAQRQITRGNYRETRTYDGLGKLKRSVRSDVALGGSVYVEVLRDAEGRVSRAYSPTDTATVGAYTLTEYDPLGRLKKITHQDGKTIDFQYLSGNTATVTNERSYVTTYTYRSYGDPDAKELVGISAATGVGSVVTSIARNKLGQVESVTQGGLTRGYFYDSRFFLDYETDPELGTIDYGRDAVGNMTTRNVGSSGTTTFVLDNLYRLDAVTYPAGSGTSNVDYGYYSDGLMEFAIKGGTRWDYGYDDNGNLTTETLVANSRSYSLTNGYDALDSLQSITYPSGLAVSYSPNALGQATAVTSGLGTHASGITYWPNGQIKNYALSNGHVVDMGQNSRLFPTTLNSKQSINGGLVTAIDVLYQYDDAGNTKSITDYFSPANSRTLLDYDGVNRLTVANGPWGSGSFGYDARNNIVSKTLGSMGSLSYAYNGATGRLDSVTGSTPYSFGYDVYGNVTANGKGATYGTFGYDEGSNLVRVGPSGNPTINYTYDANARMTVESWPNGSLTRYSVFNRASQLMYEDDVVNNDSADYVYLGSALLLKRARCTATTDSDGDGISNCNEWRNGMNSSFAGDASADADSDGLTNVQEIAGGTSIYLTDTDSDGVSDSYETRYSLNALVANSNLDSDGDTLSNLTEFQMKTNPTKKDTDNDGIDDNLDPKPNFNPAVLIPIFQLLLQ